MCLLLSSKHMKSSKEAEIPETRSFMLEIRTRGAKALSSLPSSVLSCPWSGVHWISLMNVCVHFSRICFSPGSTTFAFSCEKLIIAISLKISRSAWLKITLMSDKWVTQVFLYPPSVSLACCVLSSVMSDPETLWTITCQAALSIGFSRQEYWSGLPCPPPGDCPEPGIQPTPLMSPALAGAFFITGATWEVITVVWVQQRKELSLWWNYHKSRTAKFLEWDQIISWFLNVLMAITGYLEGYCKCYCQAVEVQRTSEQECCSAGPAVHW